MKTNLHFLIFSAGIIITIIGGAKVPAAGEKWPDSLPIFFTGFVISILTLIIWRKAVSANTVAEQTNSNDIGPKELYISMEESLEKIDHLLNEGSTAEVITEIEALKYGKIFPFIEKRDVLARTYGVEKTTEILVIFAYFERILNRVSSALADGCLLEAKKVLPESLGAYKEAKQLF